MRINRDNQLLRDILKDETWYAFDQKLYGICLSDLKLKNKGHFLKETLQDAEWHIYEGELRARCLHELSKSKLRKSFKKVLSIAAMFIVLLGGTVYLSIFIDGDKADELAVNDDQPHSLQDVVTIRTSKQVYEIVQDFDVRGIISVAQTSPMQIDRISDEELLNCVKQEPRVLIAYADKRSELFFFEN